LRKFHEVYRHISSPDCGKAATFHAETYVCFEANAANALQQLQQLQPFRGVVQFE
jgi:hypothetical protein